MKPHPGNVEREHVVVVVDRYTGQAREIRVLTTTVADARAQVIVLKRASEDIDSIEAPSFGVT